MKYIVILLVLTIAVTTKCIGVYRSGLKKPDKVTLIIKQYPTNHSVLYVIDSGTVKVWRHTTDSIPDSLIAQSAIEMKSFKACANLMCRFTKAHYENKCVEDGPVMLIKFSKNDSMIKDVRLSNYYSPSLNKIINVINTTIDSLHKIPYNKNEITAMVKKCK